jgi:hypothetical protein
MQPDKVAGDGEPFLLHESSRAFLDGDVRGIQQRFQLRRDVLDYLAIAAAATGLLLLLVKIVHLATVSGAGDDQSTTLSTVGLAGLLIAVGGYYVISRHTTAVARLRLIHEGRVLPGTLVECTGRDETTTEASFGEVTRSYVIAVEYRFAAPAGDEIADHDEHNRRDLRRVELPPAGTPVRVLYLDEQTYALL